VTSDSSPPRELLRRWFLALGAFAALLFFFSPAWHAFGLWPRIPEMSFQIEVRRGAAVLAQVAQPGAALSDPLHAVIQWRLLFPLVGRLLHLPPPLLFALAHLGALLVLAWLVTLQRRASLPWRETALALLPLGAASWFFTSTGWLGYYDSWLALALLLVAFADGRWPGLLACAWAPWVDERFVLAAPLALLCRWLHRPDRFDLRRDLLPPGALLLAFTALRLGVLASSSAPGATVSGYLAGRDFLAAPVPRIALGVWEGLRGGWLLLLAGLVALARHRPRFHLLAGASAGVALLAVGLATAQDYSRSVTMLLPLAVLGLLHAAYASAPSLTRLLFFTAPAALVLPAHHVMNDRVDRIYYLYHELASQTEPPRAANPDFYELRALHAMGRSEFAAAEADLTLAIKLARNPATPAKQRGILAATQQRWIDAHRDFSLVVTHDPQNPDAWFMRAQAGHALGQIDAAHADFAHARSLAPADWTSRPDVVRFLFKLRATPASK